MSESSTNSEVTVTLPGDLVDGAQVWAQQSGCALEEFLADAIEGSLVPFADAPKDMGEWADHDVLAMSNLQMPKEDDRQLSELLLKQKDEALSDRDGRALRQLMTVYQQMLLDKSIALREAVSRGLRRSPAS